MLTFVFFLSLQFCFQGTTRRGEARRAEEGRRGVDEGRRGVEEGRREEEGRRGEEERRRTREEEKKTPYQMFLEDDGPYSR